MELEGVGLGLSLRVLGGAAVAPRRVLPDALEHQGLVADDHARRGTVDYRRALGEENLFNRCLRDK